MASRQLLQITTRDLNNIDSSNISSIQLKDGTVILINRNQQSRTQKRPQRIQRPQYQYKQYQKQQYQQQQHTSVRVNQRPGGNSNIIFGSDDSNYDHYRK